MTALEQRLHDSPMRRIGGFGIVGLGDPGDQDPFPHRKRPDLCANFNHPGVTYNPWLGKTWCLCGEVVRDGDQAGHDDCCCGGRLLECLHVEVAS